MRYCVHVTDTSEAPAVVTKDDVKLLAERFKPGAVKSCVDLHAAYTQIVKDQGRAPAHPTTLGWALRRANWGRKKIRKRVGGKVKDTSCWIVPGAPPVYDEMDQVHEVIRDMGEGIHSDSSFYGRYDELGRRYGWTLLGSVPLSMLLTRMGYPRMVERGQPSRYLFVPRVLRT